MLRIIYFTLHCFLTGWEIFHFVVGSKGFYQRPHALQADSAADPVPTERVPGGQRPVQHLLEVRDRPETTIGVDEDEEVGRGLAERSVGQDALQCQNSQPDCHDAAFPWPVERRNLTLSFNISNSLLGHTYYIDNQF